MNTFDTLQTLFLQDLRELHLLQKRWWLVLPMTRVVREEHLGRCCYLAEEYLCPAELQALKCELAITEQQWNAYKAKLTAQ